MSESLYSPHWYRVSALKPRLCLNVQMHRHEYRGIVWYVLHDKASGRSHRFNATAYQVIGLLNGNLTINQIWDKVNDRLGDFAPSQTQMIQLLGKLHKADLLQSGLPADTEELFQRRNQHNTNKTKQYLGNPLSIKVPLWDPDAFLLRNLSLVQWLFRWQFGAFWLLFIVVSAAVAAAHWQEISVNGAENLLSPYNMAIMVLLYPALKLVHELGHAFSARFFGGEVHEMGVSFLLFMPIPYVDVSTINFLRSKWQRILVSAAGIIVELFFAALGLCLWLLAEPGLVKDIAFNMMLIGGTSSLFFNGNPLLKYDGYYILSDALAIPNLFQRAQAYLAYLYQKYLFGIPGLVSPAMAPGEPFWFVLYSVSSFIYRICLLWLIIVYITKTFFIVGAILAIWMTARQLLYPALKGLHFVIKSPSIQQKRGKVVATLVGCAALCSILVFLVPVPSYSLSEGVVWMPEEAQLRAETDGFVGPLRVNPQATLAKGALVVEINDPLLDTEAEVLLAKLHELNAMFRAKWDTDRFKAAMIKEDLLVVAKEYKNAKEKQQKMRIISKKSGRLLIPEAEDLPGRFVHQGDIIGFVLDNSLPTVRVVVNQADIGRLQKKVQDVEIRLVNGTDHIMPAKIKRHTPEATFDLPSPALAATNGGKVPIDPSAKEKIKAKEQVFIVDLEYKPVSRNMVIGQRVYVRFNHGSESLAQQWARSFRQVFLRDFNG